MPSGARAPQTFLPNQPPAHPTHVLGTPHSLRFTRATHFLALPSFAQARASAPRTRRTFSRRRSASSSSSAPAPTRTAPSPTTTPSSARSRSRTTTRRCRDFAEKGWCKRGHRCNFIHEVAPPHAPQAPPEAPPQAAFPPLPRHAVPMERHTHTTRTHVVAQRPPGPHTTTTDRQRDKFRDKLVINVINFVINS